MLLLPRARERCRGFGFDGGAPGVPARLHRRDTRFFTRSRTRNTGLERPRACVFQDFEQPVRNNLVALWLQVRDAHVKRTFLVIQKVAQIIKTWALDLVPLAIGSL